MIGIEEIKSKRTALVELAIILGLSVLVFLLASRFDVLEKVVEFSYSHEDLELDELLVVGVFLSVAFFIYSTRRWLDARKINRKLDETYLQLQNAFQEIRQLKDILPICSTCRSSRNDEGQWGSLEEYVSDNTDSKFSHGLCPNCLKKEYPEYADEILEMTSSTSSQ